MLRIKYVFLYILFIIIKHDTKIIILSYTPLSNIILSSFSFFILFPLSSSLTLQDLTVLPTEFFRRRKTHIPSVINLPTKSPMEMLRQ
jgi:hypothetical protein